MTGFGFQKDAALDLSLETQKLAVDLASFTNAQGGAEAVSKALTKAYFGETESLKTYGIAIRQASVDQKILEKGQQDLTGEAKLQARALATLEIAYSQSRNAIGDFSRTQDQLANRQRLIKARLEDTAISLGSKFLPAINAVAGGILKLLPVDDDLLAVTNDLIEANDEYIGVLSKLESGTDDLTKTERALLEIRKLELEANQAEGLGKLVERYEELNGVVKRNGRVIKGELDIAKEKAQSTKKEGDNLSELQKTILDEIKVKGKVSLANDKIKTQLIRNGALRREELTKFFSLNDVLGRLNNKILDTTKKYKEQSVELTKLETENDNLLTQTDRLANISEEYKQILKEKNEVLLSEAAALAELNKQKKADAAAEAERLKLEKERREAQAAAVGKQKELIDELKLKTEEFDKTDEELALLKLERERAKALVIADTNQETIKAVNEYYDLLKDTEPYDVQLANERKLANGKKRLWGAAYSAITDVLQGVFDTQVNLAEGGSEAEKKAKLDAFNVQKGIDITNLAISGIAAAQQAYNLASSTIPPPAGQIVGGVLAGLIGAGTIAAGAKIATKKPNFQFGGIVPGQRSQGIDSVQGNLTPKEMVLTDEDQVGLLNFIRGGGNRGEGSMPFIFQQVLETGKVINEYIYTATKNKTLKIHGNGIIHLRSAKA